MRPFSHYKGNSIPFLCHWWVLTKTDLAKCVLSLCLFTQLLIISARISKNLLQLGCNYFSSKHFEHVFRYYYLLSSVPSDQGGKRSLHGSETPFQQSGVKGVHLNSSFCFVFSPCSDVGTPDKAVLVWWNQWDDHRAAVFSVCWDKKMMLRQELDYMSSKFKESVVSLKSFVVFFFQITCSEIGICKENFLYKYFLN